uniref:DEP domain-containing protein n=1 Tax=Paramormyrops kingsleyae TaxID=1676925 RepID=A0A3B3QJY1_9TELE
MVMCLSGGGASLWVCLIPCLSVGGAALWVWLYGHVPLRGRGLTVGVSDPVPLSGRGHTVGVAVWSCAPQGEGPHCRCVQAANSCSYLCRRTYEGLELVQWLLEQCLFIQCRTMAVRVWQILLELGILLSVDQRVVFEDSDTYYRFSFEECEMPACGFRQEDEWQNGVRLLLQLAPYVQFRVGVISKRDICNEILQMKALERLTSTVRGSLSAMSWGCGLRYLFSLPPALQQGGVCTLRDKDELSRLEMVQRLAKDGCRFLQKVPERAEVKKKKVCLLKVKCSRCQCTGGSAPACLMRTGSPNLQDPVAVRGPRLFRKLLRNTLLSVPSSLARCPNFIFCHIF